MSSYRNLFPSSFTSSSIATHASSSGVLEIDLRTEMTSFLHGSSSEIAKGAIYVLRRMRRDSGGGLVACSCVDPTTLEPDKDYGCPYCKGTGYLYDEEVITGYKVNVSSMSSARALDLVKHEVGILSLPLVVFFFEYDVEPTREDVILEIELDLEGEPTLPYKPLVSYEINLLRDLRSDNGRVEYWACYTAAKGIKTLRGSL